MNSEITGKKSRKEIYIFGAGASNASAGTPLGKELVWFYYHQCHKTLYEVNENFKTTPQELKEINKQSATYSHFLKEVVPKYTEFKEEYTKLQEAINNAEEQSLPQLQKWHYIDELLKKIIEAKDTQSLEIVKRLIFEHIVESSSDSANELYNAFIDSKLKGKSSSDITIISFNFDFLLQEKITDFNNCSKNTYFDYLVNFDHILSNRSWYNRNNGFLLLKLHGSLDWSICSNCKKIVLLYEHESQSCFDKDCNGNLELFIFVPHEEKQDERIFNLWEKAREKLREAEKITVIGYSFPNYDTKARELFSKENINTDIELEIIDYEENPRKSKEKENELKQKHKQLFPQIKEDRIKIRLDGFEGYLNQTNTSSNKI